MKHKKIILSALLIFIITIIIIGFSNKLQVTKYDFKSNMVPKSFDGYKIIQISDFHCKSFGHKEENLINAVVDLKPDLIVFTGDMIDDNHSNIQNVEYLLEGIHNIAPVYSVSGNHEFDDLNLYNKLKELYLKYNVHILDDKSVILSEENESIYLHGMKYRSYNPDEVLEYADNTKFNILLNHCTNYFDILSPYGYDLIMAGHTHGGIVRLPFVGGLISNELGLFPKYDSGYFVSEESSMISSRGLGDAVIPRFYNRPELVCITLYSR